MGLTGTLLGKKVYLDANVFIYLIEGYAPIQDQLVELLTGMESCAFRS